MKKGIVNLLAGLFLICSLSAVAQTTGKSIYDVLVGDDKIQQQTVFENILKNNEKLTAVELFLGAGLAQKLELEESAAFLFYAGQIRAKADLDNFPPTELGDNNPRGILGSLSYQLGSVINASIMREPTVFQTLVNRLNFWQPVYTAEYNPGWEYKDQKNIATLKHHLAATQASQIAPMQELSDLLNNKEYYEAFITLQNYNMNAAKYADDEEMKQKKESAQTVMRSIESKRNLKGFMTSR